MKEKSLGFIGGGRVARIILGGLKKAGRMPAKIVASDTNPDVLKKLQTGFPAVQAVLNNNREPAAQELVFLGLHPPAISGSLADLKDCLKPGAILISLAPKLSIAKLRDGLGGFDRIVRLIPNAASIIGEGFNPVVFSEALSQLEKEEIKALLGSLGKCPEVAENKLEAYAVVTDERQLHLPGLTHRMLLVFWPLWRPFDYNGRAGKETHEIVARK
jgi:pyrroline-5-carboxylate reductase